MKKILIGAAALAAFAGPAFAADMPARPYTKAPAYTAPAVIYNWTGFYIGGHAGGAFAGNNSLQGSDARFLGGVQAGFDYQFAPNWVIGAEAQYSWLGGGNNNNTGVLFPGGTLVTGNIADQIGSVTGRLGSTPRAVMPGATATTSRLPWPACRRPSPPPETARTAIPSVPASNTCSR